MGRKPKSSKSWAKFPKSMAVNYYREIRPVTDRIRKLYKQIIEPELKLLLEFEYVEEPATSLDDSITEKIGRLFRKYRINYYGQEYPIDGDPNTSKFRRKLENKVSDSSKALASFHKSRFDQNANFVLGVDPLKREPWLKGYLSDWTAQNVNKIKDIPDFAAERMEQIVTESVLRGDSMTFLKEQIGKILNDSDNRIRLIARDQTNKLYGTLTELRSKFNGWEFYEWDTVEDSRVREDHRILNGNIFKFSQPPIIDRRTKERGNPGQGIQCRCVSLVVLDRQKISLLKQQDDGSYAIPAIKAA